MVIVRDPGSGDFTLPTLEITERRDDAGRVVLSFAGEIDLSTIDQMQAAVDTVVESAPRSVDIDLADVRFMDSSGLAILLTAVGTGLELRLLDPSPGVRRVIELSGLDSVLRMMP